MNIQKMMKEAQKLQAQMEEAKAEINSSEFTSNQGSGAVVITMYGTKMISNIEIQDSLLEDKEMLQDLILLAVNDCNKQIDDYTSEKMGAFTPGGMGGLF